MSVIISLQATFLHKNLVLWSVSYILDLYFIAEMYNVPLFNVLTFLSDFLLAVRFVNMHVAYYDEGGVLVTHPMACVAHYLK